MDGGGPYKFPSHSLRALGNRWLLGEGLCQFASRMLSLSLPPSFPPSSRCSVDHQCSGAWPCVHTVTLSSLGFRKSISCWEEKVAVEDMIWSSQTMFFLEEENPDLVASSLQFPFPAGCRNKSHLESCRDSLFPYITSLHAPTTTQ